MFDSDNPYLKGNFAPWREEGEAFDLEVTGSIPPELNGTLYRIGPNPHFAPIGRYHWFDGDGMVHAFILRDRRAAYRNRYVRTEGLVAEMKAGRALYGGLLNPTVEAPPGMPPFKNVANTNIVRFADRLLALWEAGLPHELEPATLATRGTFDFGGSLSGPMTAHPKLDPLTGELHFFGYQPFPPYVTYYRADIRGNLVEQRAIDTGLPTMMHDFVVTAHHALFFVCPVVFHLENMAAGKPMLTWEPNHGTRIGMMDRRPGGEVRWFETDPCYIFHFLNGYEDGNSIVVDACRLDHLDLSGGVFDATPMANRFTFDLGSGAVRREQIDDRPGDFPRLNDNLTGRAHRYGYFAGSSTDPRDARIFNSLIKRDYVRHASDVAQLGDHMTPGEPVFVPRRNAESEDDGWVLCVWYDAALNRSEMVVHDARHFAADPIARVKLEHRVPFGFHGNWLPSRK
ncbi:MAG TPA: carotenoid oxygenase family protein [Candidatus Binataceae bacterium]|nr:carotenoid oxygenase family protein [Candidatus Binataceae bacterium]